MCQWMSHENVIFLLFVYLFDIKWYDSELLVLMFKYVSSYCGEY